MPAPKIGSKHVTVEVVIPEEDPFVKVMKTDALYLSEALMEYDLVKDGGIADKSLNTINGVAADVKKSEKWVITKGGLIIATDITGIAVEDGDEFVITLTAGLEID